MASDAPFPSTKESVVLSISDVQNILSSVDDDMDFADVLKRDFVAKWLKDDSYERMNTYIANDFPNTQYTFVPVKIQGYLSKKKAYVNFKYYPLTGILRQASTKKKVATKKSTKKSTKTSTKNKTAKKLDSDRKQLTIDDYETTRSRYLEHLRTNPAYRLLTDEQKKEEEKKIIEEITGKKGTFSKNDQVKLLFDRLYNRGIYTKPVANLDNGYADSRILEDLRSKSREQNTMDDSVKGAREYLEDPLKKDLENSYDFGGVEQDVKDHPDKYSRLKREYKKRKYEKKKNTQP